MESEQGKGLGYLLERTTRLVKLSYSQAFKSHGFDITPEQWVVIEQLYYNNGQSQNDLASFSFKDAPTISRIIDLLVKKGVVIREKGNQDKRARNVLLTASGQKLVESMEPLVSELRSRGWKNLSQNDFDDFVRIIDQVFDNYKK